jgi:hypothetical protein
MIVLLIVLAVVVALAIALAFGGGFGGYGGYGGQPTVVRRVIHRRAPVRRVVTEHHVVDDPYVAGGAYDPVDGPVYRP